MTSRDGRGARSGDSKGDARRDSDSRGQVRPVTVTARGKLPLNRQINLMEHIKPILDLLQRWLLLYALETIKRELLSTMLL